MAKRIKRVFSNGDQVIHLWANQSQDTARSRNVFFQGVRLYSYGYHYELGRLVKYRGKQVAIINDTGYSVTTSKHIRRAWGAVAGQLRVKAKDFNIAHGLKAAKAGFESGLARALRRRPNKTLYSAE